MARAQGGVELCGDGTGWFQSLEMNMFKKAEKYPNKDNKVYIQVLLRDQSDQNHMQNQDATS